MTTNDVGGDAHCDRCGAAPAKGVRYAASGAEAARLKAVGEDVEDGALCEGCWLDLDRPAHAWVALSEDEMALNTPAGVVLRSLFAGNVVLLPDTVAVEVDGSRWHRLESMEALRRLAERSR